MSLAPCPKSDIGTHAFEELGRCHHSHGTGGNDYIALRCTACGLFAHRGPISFACGVAWRSPAQMQVLQAREHTLCPITIARTAPATTTPERDED